MSHPAGARFGAAAAGGPPPMMPPPPGMAGMAGMPPPLPPAMGVPMDQSDADEHPPPLPADAGKTLYIQNLNEKVKLETMKATLTNLFSNYANVLSVVSHTNVRMRGQAFVALDDVQAADKARREAHLFPLYGKAMKISFAKSRSDAVVAEEADGGKESDEFQKHKEQRLEHKKMARRGNVLRRRELEKKIRAKRAAAGEIAEPEKPAGAAAASKRAQQEMPDEYLPPNKMLFLQNIPDGVGKGELESLFSAYTGYVDVQTIPGKADIAFVEFSDIPSSITARGALNGYNFGAGDKLKITFARA